MKTSRFSELQIAFILMQVDDGIGVEEVCRKAGISQQTNYRWRKKYGGLMPSGVRRLKPLEEGCCQSNANLSPNCPAPPSSDRQLTLFGRCGRSVLLEEIPAVEMTIVVEMVVKRSLGGGKLLPGFDVPEPSLRPLSSSKRLV